MEILCKGGKNPCYYDSVVRWDKELLPIKKITAHSAFSFIGLGINPTCHTERPLQGWVTPATKQQPCISGAFYLERIRNEKYIPVDFDEKGNAVLGREKNTPTSNGFIPTTWAPGGGSDENKQGLKSISISPTIQTTPALDSLFPIYYDDLEEPPIPGSTRFAEFELESEESAGGNYTVIITPTSDWQLYDEANDTMLGKGVPLTIEYENISNPLLISASAYADPDDDDAPVIVLTITITITGSK